MSKLVRVLATSAARGIPAGIGFRMGSASPARVAAESVPPAPHPPEGEQTVQALIDRSLSEIEERPGNRVAGVEEELARLSAGLSELRECSIQTERNLQRLLHSPDRILPPVGAAGKQAPRIRYLQASTQDIRRHSSE